jgi:hypothetical protein
VKIKQTLYTRWSVPHISGSEVVRHNGVEMRSGLPGAQYRE